MKHPATASILLLVVVVTSLSAFGQRDMKSAVKISCPLLQSHPARIVRPVYPELARQAYVEGRVSLDCFIGTDGLVEKIEVKKGHPLLIQAATDAVAQWKFKPMLLNGKAVKMETVVNIDFQLPKKMRNDTAKPPENSENPDHPDVVIDGLNRKYPSCALVQFSVRNISQQEVYVEVYSEDFKSKAWTDTDYPYDLLRDPRSRYKKLVIVNPDMMRPGASVNVTYDRCLKPSFVKQRESAFINAIKKKDNEAATPVWQRFRVDVYILDQGHVKRVQQVGANSFERVPDK